MINVWSQGFNLVVAGLLEPFFYLILYLIFYFILYLTLYLIVYLISFMTDLVHVRMGFAVFPPSPSLSLHVIHFLPFASRSTWPAMASNGQQWLAIAGCGQQ